jgi:formylglycine-generating enzyme
MKNLLILIVLFAAGCKESTHSEKPIDITFKEIPAGTFMMGDPGDPYHAKIHKVLINKAFFLQTTEVTQGQWKALMGTEPWRGQEFSKYVKEGDNFPAVYVTWDDAIAYCEKLGEKDGKAYRLPTESEWEYACRAGTTTTWSFGENEKSLGDYAWYKLNSFDVGEEYPHRVQLKMPNAFGLYDMHGNVSEWCQDYYVRDYQKPQPDRDPFGSPQFYPRVVRGGSGEDSSRRSHSASRNAWDHDKGWAWNGFRVVRELD